MPKDEFDLEDTNFNEGGETSLDDFFQPADKAGGKKAAASPSVDDFFAPAGQEAATKLTTETMPVSKKGGKPPPDIFDDIKSDEPAGPDVHPPPVPLGDEAGAGEEAAAAEKGFLARNWLILLIVALVIVLGGSGGFLAVTYFLKPKPTVAQAALKPPAAKPKPAAPKPASPPVTKPMEPTSPTAAAPAKPMIAGGETKPAAPAKPMIAGGETKPAVPAKPMIAGGETKPAVPAKPMIAGGETKPAAPAKPAPVALKPPAKPSPAPALAMAPKPGHVPVPFTGGPYMVQVGSYMLEASKKEPEAKLTSLGYTQWHYVPESRRLTIYHVYAGKALSRSDADQLAGKLEGMGYAPTVEPDGTGYRVEVYTYGSSKVAKSVRSKLIKKGIKGLAIRSETKVVDLDQLRVGGFPSQAQAKKALADIKKGGLRGAVIVKE